MLHRPEHSPEVTKATDQMTAVVRDFLRDGAIPRELVEFAACEAMRVLRAHRWSSSQVLTYCRQLINAQAARPGRETTPERQAWLCDQLSTWLMECGEKLSSEAE